MDKQVFQKDTRGENSYCKNIMEKRNLQLNRYRKSTVRGKKVWLIWLSLIMQVICLLAILLSLQVFGQTDRSIIDSFRLYGDVKVTFDRPADFMATRKTIVVFFALPNGNTTDQTMGKKMQPGDDWHFDIQHIKAQTKFIRQQLNNNNFIVVYLENDYKSWPAWKQKHIGFRDTIPHMVDSISSVFSKKREVHLNGHSGGGSFIFGYLAGVRKVPGYIKRISFLDSNYGYDSTYYPKIREWILNVNGALLNVFAYNDSIALYNGKPFVSATGGTWYRSHLMLKHLEEDFSFYHVTTDSMKIARSKGNKIQFFLKYNLNRGIYHTQQVELNGFIHSVLCGTKYDSRRYSYYGRRVYDQFIE